MLHIKYNGKMYYLEVPEISKHSWKYELFIFKPLGKLFNKNPNFDALCGTNITSTIITF